MCSPAQGEKPRWRLAKNRLEGGRLVGEDGGLLVPADALAQGWGQLRDLAVAPPPADRAGNPPVVFDEVAQRAVEYGREPDDRVEIGILQRALLQALHRGAADLGQCGEPDLAEFRLVAANRGE